jgi:hypothetical protein
MCCGDGQDPGEIFKRTQRDIVSRLGDAASPHSSSDAGEMRLTGTAISHYVENIDHQKL